jgi:hypothetical protein
MTTPNGAAAMKLGTIKAEAALCRAAFAAAPEATHAWHCHHETLLEQLIEPAEHRIVYILSDKPKGEQALRLHLFRPASAATAAAWKTYDAATAPARKTYDAVLAAARKTYDAATAPARKTYYAATAAARKTYDAAVTAARKTYYAAVTAAWKTYDAAVTAARKTYDAATAPAHALECPDCPWDGSTIFPVAA